MLPIFQMAIDFTPEGKIGLIFSTEAETYYLPPVFTIQISNIGPIFQQTYYMPGELKGEPTNFVANWDNYFLSIRDTRLTQSISFVIPYYYPRVEEMRETAPYFDSFGSLPYIGTNTKIASPNDRFALLYPLDLMSMDAMYKLLGACFVGLTPVFGNANLNG
jgi:hypothetical protein